LERVSRRFLGEKLECILEELLEQFDELPTGQRLPVVTEEVSALSGVVLAVVGEGFDVVPMMRRGWVSVVSVAAGSPSPS
jgi:hypothetical protein